MKRTPKVGDENPDAAEFTLGTRFRRRNSFNRRLQSTYMGLESRPGIVARLGRAQFWAEAL